MGGRRVALLFPGQASQYVGMGKSLASAFPEAKDALVLAEQVAGFSLIDLCFNGPESTLSLTEFQQPCVLAVSIAAYEVLRIRYHLKPVCVTGHSLGEYSALVAAKSLAFEEAVPLVRTRGQLMQEAFGVGRGGMLALIGRDRIDVEGLCVAVSNDREQCWPSNYNSPAQVVISGHAAAIDRAEKRAKNFGARRVARLQVSAPFHSPLMESAADIFARKLSPIEFKIPACPVYSNVTAEHHADDPDAIRDLLVQQITAPVLFEQIGHRIAEDLGSDGIAIEIGPKTVLSGLMQKIAPEITVVNFGEAADLPGIEEVLG